MPLLSILNDMGKRLDMSLEDVLTDFFESDFCTVESGTQREIVKFVRTLEEVDQTPNEWNQNYLPRIDFGEKALNPPEETKMAYNLEQAECLEEGINFIKEYRK
jgi:hypothetical protein